MSQFDSGTSESPRPPCPRTRASDARLDAGRLRQHRARCHADRARSVRLLRLVAAQERPADTEFGTNLAPPAFVARGRNRIMPHADMSFREAAEQCRRLAALATDPVEKLELQHLADVWLRLAQLADLPRTETLH